MGRLIAWLRLAAVVLGVVAVIATYVDTARRATINPFNFFGYFTMQSNIIWLFVMAVTATVALQGIKQSERLLLARAFATTYMVIVGAVYNTILVGHEGGIALAWANSVVHVVLPIYAAVDWMAFGDRHRLAWKLLWVTLVYPVVWIVVVLIRGATDGWVPYPFLDPDTGYALVFTYVTVITLVTIVAASIVWALSRLHIIEIEEPMNNSINGG